MGAVAPSYKGHRYPVEVISHCVWLYHRFPLSFREVEELMLERGVTVSYETVRRWCAKFGQTYAGALRRRQPRPGDKWHLDEVFIKINGEQKYLWRAVDQDGNVLDILVQDRRDKAAARRFLRRLMKKTRTVPRVIVTDRLRSYGAVPPRGRALRRAPAVEVPQQPGREQPPANKAARTGDEGLLLRGRSTAVSVRVQRISPHFRPRRHLMTAHHYRAEMTIRFAIWDQITGTADRPTTA
ncbi:putative transposase [Streptomyces sp. 1222.2]|nr:putative transposase [Streptomyces sp. 1222.2]